MAGESFAALNADDVARPRILIYVHDSFKPQATRGGSIRGLAALDRRPPE